jgi:hypothetical protein
MGFEAHTGKDKINEVSSHPPFARRTPDLRRSLEVLDVADGGAALAAIDALHSIAPAAPAASFQLVVYRLEIEAHVGKPHYESLSK